LQLAGAWQKKDWMHGYMRIGWLTCRGSHIEKECMLKHVIEREATCKMNERVTSG
jgi:hypothetical protein